MRAELNGKGYTSIAALGSKYVAVGCVCLISGRHINDSFMCRVYHQYVTSSSCSTDFVKDELKQNWTVMLFAKPLSISKPMRSETQNVCT